MNNQDSSATAHPSISLRAAGEVEASTGETKYEKAFWQVFSAMCTDKMNSPEDTAVIALSYVNAGFEALDTKD